MGSSMKKLHMALYCMRQDIQEQIIAANIREYGEPCRRLTWLSPEQAERASEQRAALLQTLEGAVQFGYNKTKLDCQTLAPGCKICGEGAWSCLFINGKCPCGCFYCPTEQTKIDVPHDQYGFPFINRSNTSIILKNSDSKAPA